VETNFKADEFLNLSLAERVENCRLMAREAESGSADSKSPELRAAYSDLAKQGSILADEIARHISRS
jgi:hypothetical protein